MAWVRNNLLACTIWLEIQWLQVFFFNSKILLETETIVAQDEPLREQARQQQPPKGKQHKEKWVPVRPCHTAHP